MANIKYSFPAEFMDVPEYDQHIVATIKDHVDQYGAVDIEVLVGNGDSVKTTLTLEAFYSGEKCKKYYPDLYVPKTPKT